jgi:hypothetical protein
MRIVVWLLLLPATKKKNTYEKVLGHKSPTLFWGDLMCHRIAKYAIVITASLLSISCAADGYFEVFEEATTYISRPPPVVVHRAPSTYYQFPQPKRRYNPPPVVIYETPRVIYESPTIIYEEYNYPAVSDVFIYLP